MKVVIDNMGCDDTTRTIMDLKKEELDILIKFARKNNENSYSGCQPCIAIYNDFEEIIDDEGDVHIRVNYKKDLMEK